LPPSPIHEDLVIWCTNTEKTWLSWPRSVGDTAAAGDSPPAAYGGGIRAMAVGVVHNDLPAPALLAAERPVASACTHIIA